ncbi:unnamed protein product [Albugo candida]|uniref:Uncharacterized protein n=1 Tax=Albugo candida TaxID=65357 RepID=A0A024GPY4_9STRA|nr:unnamed protein product [Albugo candida]|eukprot:CCI48621.1 unnamed protein product [Albugo candida]
MLCVRSLVSIPYRIANLKSDKQFSIEPLSDCSHATKTFGVGAFSKHCNSTSQNRSNFLLPITHQNNASSHSCYTLRVRRMDHRRDRRIWNVGSKLYSGVCQIDTI